MAIRAVMFDAVGTLIHADPPVAQVYCAEGWRHGSRLAESEVFARLKRFIPRRLSADSLGSGPHETNQQDLVRRWQQVVRDVFRDLHDTSSVFEALWCHFAQARSWALYPDVVATLDALRAAGIETGVASNFDDRLDRICHELRLTDDSSRIFHSARLGVQKPAREFFRKIEAELGLRSQELSMVGDDWQEDYQAARQAGWQSFWLRRDGPRSDANQLANLHQLVDVIA